MGIARHAAVYKYCDLNKIKNNCINWYSTSWKDAIKACLSILLPRSCAGCDAPDAVLCENCKQELCCWQRAPLSSFTCGYRYSCGIYANSVRRAILLWKDHYDVACDTIFASLLSNLAVNVISELLRSHFLSNRSKPILVVPMPSSYTSTHNRGRKHILPLARTIVNKLSNNGIPALLANIVRMNSSITSKSVQTSDGARGRSLRAAHAFKVDLRMLEKQLSCSQTFSTESAYEAILIDDIVTTGSTMNSCATKLQDFNIRIVAGFSLACVKNIGDGTENYGY